MIKFFFVLGLELYLTNQALAITCLTELPNLEVRESEAHAIFTGVAVKDGKLESANIFGVKGSKLFNGKALAMPVNRVVRVKVDFVVKGDLKTGDVIDVNYRLPGEHEDCEDGVRESFWYAVENKVKSLFFVLRSGDRYFTSYELGGGNLELKRIKADFEVLTKK